MNAFKLVLCLTGLVIYSLLRPLAPKPEAQPSAPAFQPLPATESPATAGLGSRVL